MTVERITVLELEKGDQIVSPHTHREVIVKRIEQPVLGMYRIFISDHPFDCHDDYPITRVKRAAEIILDDKTLRKTFTVKRRDPTDRESAHDMKCLVCEYRSSGWTRRRKALDAGYAHARKEHDVPLPAYDAAMKKVFE